MAAYYYMTMTRRNNRNNNKRRHQKRSRETNDMIAATSTNMMDKEYYGLMSFEFDMDGYEYLTKIHTYSSELSDIAKCLPKYTLPGKLKHQYLLIFYVKGVNPELLTYTILKRMDVSTLEPIFK